MTKALRFCLPNEHGTLEFAPEVMSHFEAHKQLRWLAKEAGGQLFCRFESPSSLHVLDVTGPRSTDKRSIYNYQPDRAAERVEIRDRYSRGLHFIGDWHTHKQRIPKPSGTDTSSIRDMVSQSDHDLAGFVLVIVGQAPFPDGLHVSFHTKSISIILRPEGNDSFLPS